MKFDIDYIEKLAKVLSENSLTEISLEDGEEAVTLRKEVFNSAPVAVQTSLSPQSATTEQAPVKKGRPLTSPMVGTFYSAPSPDAEPFVKVGQTVKEGDVVCIVEAMKLMNEIESELSGKVLEICVSDGQPVEFGQVLMYIE